LINLLARSPILSRHLRFTASFQSGGSPVPVHAGAGTAQSSFPRSIETDPVAARRGPAFAQAEVAFTTFLD
jgi:hypothetical protein